MKPVEGQIALLPDHVLRASTVPRRGHAARPGSGPEGQTCGSCRHYTRRITRGGTFRKCGLTKATWTGGPGSDIRKKDPACHLWEAEEAQSTTPSP